MTAPRIWLAIGAISAGIAVAAGAFGAHALRARLSPADLATFETGARYQMYHALALSGPAQLAGWCFVAGTLLFSGSLYLLTLTDTRWLGAITPLGGVAFLVGWVALAVAGLRITEP
jgi:uncharacterized membrane protein YgdD (TMEM256/DUF423 family)